MHLVQVLEHLQQRTAEMVITIRDGSSLAQVQRVAVSKQIPSYYLNRQLRHTIVLKFNPTVSFNANQYRR